MVSTIQLSNEVKETLAQYRKSPRESYEDVIVKLISEYETKKRQDEELLIEGYQEMAEESLKICKEWEHLDNELLGDWEWKE